MASLLMPLFSSSEVYGITFDAAGNRKEVLPHAGECAPKQAPKQVPEQVPKQVPFQARPLRIACGVGVALPRQPSKFL